MLWQSSDHDPEFNCGFFELKGGGEQPSQGESGVVKHATEFSSARRQL